MTAAAAVGLDRRVTGIRVRAIEAMPYLARALFRLRMVPTPGLGTFAVDPGWRCYYDPACLDTWTPAECAGVLLHEVSHLLRGHADRGQAHAPGDHQGFNIAGDLEINDDLVGCAAVTMPEGCLHPTTMGFDCGLTAEAYYDLLDRDSAGDSGGGNSDGDGDGDGDVAGSGNSDGDGVGGDGTCGSGAAGGSRPWELPDDDETAPALSDADADITRRQVALDVRSHADRNAKNRGTVPAGLTRWADETLAPPTVPWQKILASAVRHGIRRVPGNIDFSYARRSRRSSGRVVMPGMVAYSPSVAVIIDTSGSMSAADLTAALSETQGIVRRCGVTPESFQVFAVDADAAAPQRVTDARKIELTGGGGTDMRVGIAAALAEKSRPDVIVVLTDGYTPWPDTPVSARLVIGVIGDTTDPPATPAWAHTVLIPTGAAE